MLKAIDLCSGCGGWPVAAKGLPIQIVAAYDLWDDALETYKLNFPDVACIKKDVRELTASEIVEEFGKIDLVLAGIPCEAISRARGNLKASNDEMKQWEGILRHCLQIAEELGPRYWVFEDVPTVVKFLPILTQTMIIDAEEYGPQRRKRAFFGHFPYPRINSNGMVLGDCLSEGPFIVPRKKQLDGRKARIKKHPPLKVEQKSKTIINLARCGSDVSTLVCHFPRDRVLTMEEAARIQGFPKDFCFVGSRTGVSKMVGQAIPIYVGAAILEKICEKING